MSNYRITVIGCGYVGFSLATVLGLTNEITVYDIDKEKLSIIKNGKSPIIDDGIDNFIKKNKIKYSIKSDLKESLNDADFAIIAVPTDLKNNNSLDTSIIETLIGEIQKIRNDLTIIIKSTVPIGFTESLRKKYNTEKIIFSPEFLREGMALNDHLMPSRIIMGCNSKDSIVFSKILIACSEKKDIEVLYVSNSEAEAIKLFSNTYLAMRVSFFNELDSFAISKNLNSQNIIEGVCHDPRIGNNYNNPSFGFGGYCLPKDSLELAKSFINIPSDLIHSINHSNSSRKEFLANEIYNTQSKIIGVYRLSMKNKSSNFYESAILDIIESLSKRKVEVIIYEPLIKDENFNNFKIIKDLNDFKNKADLIIANRFSNDLIDVKEKLFSRDIFGIN